MHVGVFLLEHVKAIWGHYLHLSENMAVTQKRFILDRNGRKFEPQGCMWHAFGVLTLNISRAFGTLSENWSITQKHLIVEQNARKFEPRGVCSMHVGIFDLELVKVIWSHSVHFCKNWAVTKKKAHFTAKLTKIWASGVYVTCMLASLTFNMSRSFWDHLWSTFPKNGHNSKTTHRHVKVIWGHSVYMYFLRKGGVTRERLIMERKR